MPSNVFVMNPTAPPPGRGPQQRKLLDSLAGKVAGFIDNSKPNFHHLVDELGALLIDRYGVKYIVKHGKHVASIPAPAVMLQDLQDRCDFVMTGLGD